MEKKNHLYIIIAALLIFILAIFLGAFNRDDVKLNQEVLNIFKKNNVVAAIGVDENGNISMFNRSGKPATRCTLNTKSKSKTIPKCRGIDNGIVSVKVITLFQTIGSICYTRYKPDGTEEQACWPE